MRTVIQRVTSAELRIDSRLHSSIGRGLLVLVGIEEEDTHEDAIWLAGKLAKMRIFADEQGVMNLSAEDTRAEVMIVSQFTLHASTRKGNRPSYIRAARPQTAVPLYEYFVEAVRGELARDVATGMFGADMQITLTNDGPVTILMDSKNRE